jgi:hypothetical protein
MCRSERRMQVMSTRLAHILTCMRNLDLLTFAWLSASDANRVNKSRGSSTCNISVCAVQSYNHAELSRPRLAQCAATSAAAKCETPRALHDMCMQLPFSQVASSPGLLTNAVHSGKHTMDAVRPWPQVLLHVHHGHTQHEHRGVDSDYNDATASAQRRPAVMQS